jgi:hypothetical protein
VPVRLTAWLVCGLALWGAACGSGTATGDGGPVSFGDAGVASCTIVELFDGGTGTLCLETLADVGASFQQACAQNAAAATTADAGTVTFIDGPCARADALGACQANVDGLIENQWYYGSGGDSGTSVFGQTASDIQTLCAGMGATYLPP